MTRREVGVYSNEATTITTPPSGQRSLVVEMIGPAGAGKSTLIRELQRQDGQIKANVHFAKPVLLPFYVRNTLPWLPSHLHHHRSERWFSRDEIRSMVYLDAWRQTLLEQAKQNDQIRILDHGPVFRLAILREFGPPLTRNEKYRHWWNEMLEKWTELLNVIVWLDASDETLYGRIHARRQKHEVKGLPAVDVAQFLGRYRRTYEEIVARMTRIGHLSVLRFSTSNTSAAQLAQELTVIFQEGVASGRWQTTEDRRK